MTKMPGRLQSELDKPTNGSNHNLLQEYIDEEDVMTSGYTIEILKEIQSRLTEGTEYEIGKEYEFRDGNFVDWRVQTLTGFNGYKTNGGNYKYIRPLSDDLADAIALVEASGYTLTK